MTLNDLRDAIQGRLLLAGEPGFELAARSWNLTVEQPVAAVAEAASVADICAVVSYAAKAGIPIAVQPTGHGATGGIGDAILLRTGRLDTVTIDAENRVATVGAGATWGAVQAAAAVHGLTGLPGSNPVVGVTGYTLGGGLGWFSRKSGWASNAVRAFDIVGADGEPAHVTAESDPDLFWALQGGGGDFAVVTGLEFSLFPAPALYGGRVSWPGTRTRDVFRLFQRLTQDAPDELTVWFDRAQFPGAAPLTGLIFAYHGEPEQGRQLLAGIDEIGGASADSRGPLDLASLGELTAEPTDPTPSLSRGELVTGFSDTTLRTLLDEPVAPLLAVQLRHLGGALARPCAGARGPLAEPYLLFMVGLGLPPFADAALARRREIVDRMAPDLTGRKPHTFLCPGESAADAFDSATLARLREVKNAYDPQSVIRANYPVLS